MFNILSNLWKCTHRKDNGLCPTTPIGKVLKPYSSLRAFLQLKWKAPILLSRMIQYRLLWLRNGGNSVSLCMYWWNLLAVWIMVKLGDGTANLVKWLCFWKFYYAFYLALFSFSGLGFCYCCFCLFLVFCSWSPSESHDLDPQSFNPSEKISADGETFCISGTRF